MGLFNLKGDHPKSIGGTQAGGPSSPALGATKSAVDDSKTAREPVPEPPPYHDWTVIPDTAILPPPPTVAHEASNTSNATRSEADRAHDWCRANPLLHPHQPQPYHLNLVQDGHIDIVRPAEFKGRLDQINVGSWLGQSKPGMTDALLLSSLPLYFALADAPAHSGRKKVIYFEAEIRAMKNGKSTDESSLAIGFCALPQPTWRLPGWQRATLGVHSDDGRRYVNNAWGGKDFTRPFGPGDTIGIGMSFENPVDPPEYDQRPAQPRARTETEVFLTRNGVKEGSWNLHEQLDHDELPVDGLDGLFDLYAAIGVFGGVDFVAKFRRDEWLWRPHY